MVAASARRRSSSQRALSPRSGVSEAYQAVTCALKAHRVAVDHVDRARLTGGGSKYSTLACSTPGLLLCQFRRAVIATKASTAAAIAPRTIG